MRVLVTGSSGFVGGEVARHLSSEPGMDVVGFDLVPDSSGTVHTIVGDLTDREAVEGACDGVDVVVHLGGVGDVDVAMDHAELAAAANVVGTVNVALGAAGVGARVVYASTWEVYGPIVYEPVDEQHPCFPQHFYGATKLAGEQMLRAAHSCQSLKVTVLRLGTVYGPGMRPNTVFRRFADRARTGERILVQGSGRQWRQFTHTSDVAAAFLAACESDLPDWLVLNIVADESVTINELAHMISDRYGSSIAFTAGRSEDPPPARVSPALAHSSLGWKAETSFETGLGRLLDLWDRSE